MRKHKPAKRMRVHDFEICRPATLEEIVAEHELELKEHNAITQRMVDAAPPMPIRVSFRSEAARRMVEQLVKSPPSEDGGLPLMGGNARID